jgi:DNA polymerase III epsilon subunit-like protein
MSQSVSNHPSAHSFVIYDLETTGLDPLGDDLIQIAAVRFCAGEIWADDAFFRFAKPRRSISSFIESYTGIGNRHVASAPCPEEVLCEFSSWAGPSTLIAHNGLRFDSIHISKMLFGSTRGTGHSLDHLKSRLGLAESSLRRHDARGDVDILGRAVAAMVQRLGLDHALTGVRRHESRLPLV